MTIRNIKLSDVIKIITSDEYFPKNYMCNSISLSLSNGKQHYGHNSVFVIRALFAEYFGIEYILERDMVKIFPTNKSVAMSRCGISAWNNSNINYKSSWTLRREFIKWLQRRIDLSGDYELSYLDY